MKIFGAWLSGLVAVGLGLWVLSQSASALPLIRYSDGGSPAQASASPSDGGTATPARTKAGTSGETACVDAWIKENDLDKYGNKHGTMYMGGTPLFNMRGGGMKDRVVYIFEKHEDVRTRCEGK